MSHEPPSTTPRKQSWQEAEAALLSLVPPGSDGIQAEAAARAPARASVLHSPPGRGTAVFVALGALYQLRRAMPLADVTPWDFGALFTKGYGTVAVLVLFPSLVSLWGIARGDLKRQGHGSAWFMLQAVVWALMAVVALFKGEFVTALLMPWHLALVCSIQMHTVEPPLEAPVPPRASPPPPTVRPATPEDQDAIAGLQDAALARRPTTFEVPVEGEEDGRHPVLVAEEDGRVVACVATRAYSSRECYADIADFSLFVAKDVRGRGLDELLLKALLKAAEEAGFHKLTTSVLADQAHTLKLFERLRFTTVGTHEKHARVDGAWRDVVVVEKFLR
ncbi:MULTISPECIES: GNAT family N-acetyltransferase [unclassified Corallococcus]|uniref:GNAT family N-acetyltransferase n=1 Tax=unclassified Corallococcus TaxID=2685029 RepID=UPI001A8E8C44|nr:MULTISPECIES: GNAT family N-acetyltransferase [unclassified Corallococcus]MBN9681550.1 GNAT family N-acetyltransferase [Corallococcus sp. NCSPR001]WAS86874.1 GNAT family N-acetyltransferase [Corallococcus sp. NCRR]